jgi:trehalose/maltose hydrolase-like predicted phosphorylase
MWPWESAFTGQEVCPSWAPTGALEQHISGDVSYAVWQYYLMTGDLQWLSAVGWPILQGVAEFWSSRVTLSGADGLYHIEGVIPPDEYAVNVTDSVYTNVVAAMALQFATTAAALLHEPSDPQWSSIAAHMYVPYNSSADWHPEYEGYALGTKIKQADVVLLGFPLGYPLAKSTRSNDLKYYESVTDDGGPAMTWAMSAVAYLEIGDPDTAALRFARGYANAQAPFNVWTETPTGGAINFITGAGGFLQSVIYGYPGLRVHESELALNPQLPPNVSRLALKAVSSATQLLVDLALSQAAHPRFVACVIQLQYQSLQFDISYTATLVTVTLQSNPNSLQLTVTDASGHQSSISAPGQALTVSAGSLTLAV